MNVIGENLLRIFLGVCSHAEQTQMMVFDERVCFTLAEVRTADCCRQQSKVTLQFYTATRCQ